MSQIFGCGVDIEELSRFGKHTEQNEYCLMKDVCTQREIDNLGSDERLRLALSFSCKEAFFKALGVSWTNSPISWKDIELLFSGPGLDIYKVHLHGYAKELLLRNQASIGETFFDVNDEFAMFQVVLLKQEEW